MPVIRVFYPGLPSANAWTSGAAAVNKSAVVISFNALPDAILSGADDAALSHFFGTAPTGYPIYYSYYHEPEVHIQEGQFTVSAYKAAWAHIVALAGMAHNPDLHSTLILTSWDLSPQSGRNWQDYLPAGGVISTLGWDDYPAGSIEDRNPQATPPADFMSAEVAAARSVGLPFGFAEFALATPDNRPAWLAQIANYMTSSGALFGTYFESSGWPAMELNDSASQAAWRNVVAHSGSSVPAPAPAPAPSTPTPTAAPKPTESSKPTPAPTAGPAGLTITKAAVVPAAFAPTGQNHVRILSKISQEANVAICVLNSQGTVMRVLVKPYQSAGWSSKWYLGYDQNGRLLPAGRYSILIVAANTTGSAVAQSVLTITSQ